MQRDRFRDDSEDDDPPLPRDYPLTEDQISRLSLHRLEELWSIRERDDDLSMGGDWEDQDELQFRRTALEMLAPSAPHWITSVGCAQSVLTWLKKQPTLVPDLIPKVRLWRDQLEGPAAKQPDAAERRVLWDAVCLAVKVPQRNTGDGCEYLAHVICEEIQLRNADCARRYLEKAWVVAQANVLHPPDNWGHHVAPVIDCTDGLFVFDPLLSPRGPMPLLVWQVAAKGAANTPVFHLTQPWELLGRPNYGNQAFDPATYMFIDMNLRREMDRCMR
ncbi:protein-glutamine glutaminase family protein [Yinghuangia seranimata]|uniref:protein-glutamine glutaminase family protein n=1 Tax=Yinghuangia seranimata TaxID=408067 RepID=UPI00248C5288|nr:protein-glutamine glutaminase family protein [Yinghuangia seranimata]MDI2126468.1 protein-glutamine glutaminase family protein [Yinghuangia seranimata]